jgi:ElaB/YqjD/DUF883 family membrane-anchored ribosome-binding protein
LSDKAANLAEEALETAEENLREVEKQARRTIDDARSQAGNIKSHTDAKVTQSVGAIENYVRTNPLQAAGMAFFAGVFAASLLRK